MKKYISILLSLLLSLSFVTNVSAVSNEEENEDIQAMNDFVNEYSGYVKEVPKNEKSALAWELARDNRFISVDSDGHIQVETSSAEEALSDEYYNFIESVDLCNYLVDLKLLEVNPETLEINNLEITEESLDAMEAMDTIENQSQTIDTLRFRISGEHCSYQKLDVGTLVDSNLNEIVHVKSGLVDMGVEDPYMAAVAYWVQKVKTYGDWDYKWSEELSGEQLGDTILCCTYARGTDIHRKTEWLGNYNYGYTGTALFPLDILHLGSYAISGFDSDDKITDWPAVDEGYYDSPYGKSLKYLDFGHCSISNAGVGKVYVYGGTAAKDDVDYVSVSVYLDRYNESTGRWEQVKNWQERDSGTYFASKGTSVTVDRGYQYRVHCDHVAGMNMDRPYESISSISDIVFVK